MGYHLIQKLLAAGAHIAVLDLPGCSTKRLAPFMHRIQFYEGDVTIPEQVESIIQTVKPTYVFHLAGYGINAKEQDLDKAIRVNIMGGAHVVNALDSTSCLKLVNMGTSSEYGTKEDPLNETLRPASIYGSTKAAATLVMHQLARSKGLNMVTLRPFNIYGEWEEPHKLFCNVMLDILQNKEILLTPCQQERDYVYAGDVAQAMLLAAKSFVTDQVMDIASGQPHPLTHYVSAIIKASGSSCIVRYGAYDYRKDEVFKHHGNPHKIYSLLGWKPETSLETGIDKMFAWFKNNLYHYV